jgi:hypothetical protein
MLEPKTLLAQLTGELARTEAQDQAARRAAAGVADRHAAKAALVRQAIAAPRGSALEDEYFDQLEHAQLAELAGGPQ